MKAIEEIKEKNEEIMKANEEIKWLKMKLEGIYNSKRWKFISPIADLYVRIKNKLKSKLGKIIPEMTKKKIRLIKNDKDIKAKIFQPIHRPRDFLTHTPKQILGNNNAENIKAIAFYLPQYHPIPENDKWWGKGFTEWSNVSKAKPQFQGHYQPHLPADLGFYDLRVPETREQQAKLARENGIYGFCYYYYWFNGKKLLGRPLETVFKSKKPNFPFCICWANENWTRRWDGSEDEILIAQDYSLKQDKKLIEEILPMFSDKRYIRIDNKPLFIVYRINLLPNPKQTVKIWRDYCREHGIGEIYLCAIQSFDFIDPRKYGFDAAIEFPPHRFFVDDITPRFKNINDNFVGNIYNYEDCVRVAKNKEKPKYNLFRTVMPSWDNTARRSESAHIVINSTPDIYKSWLSSMCNYTRRYFPPNQRFIFINAWNEWAEGCHLEPDVKFGRSYLQATKEVINDSDLLITKELIKPFSKKHLVSVIVLSCNHEKYILKALNSVRQQTYLKIEVIIVDYGSTDNSLEIIKKVVRESKMKIRFFSKENMGAHNAINFGIRQSRGKYITILKSDGFFHPSRIDLLVQSLEVTGARLAFSKVNFINEKSDDISELHPTAIHYSKKRMEVVKYPSIGFALFDFNISISIGNLFFSKSLFNSVGEFRDLKSFHDWDFILRSIYYDEPIFLDCFLYNYRIHDLDSFLNLKKIVDSDVHKLLSTYFSIPIEGSIPNTLFPCKKIWGEYFDIFIKERGY